MAPRANRNRDWRSHVDRSGFCLAVPALRTSAITLCPPSQTTHHNLLPFAMRTLILTLLLIFAALPAHAQTESIDFFVVAHELKAERETIQSEAAALAETNDYLDKTGPTGDPTALLPGDLRLHIEGAPFTLYIQSVNHHSKVRLESRRLDIGPEPRKEAEAFLRKVAENVAKSHG